VSVIIGASAYRPVVDRFGKGCVVAGFEPRQMLAGLLRLARQADQGVAAVENVYEAVVSDEGNRPARELLRRVFVTADAPWRALGVISSSGLEFAPAYEQYDAVRRFDIAIGSDDDNPACRCGEVIQGKVEPPACPLFGDGCTPLTPVGPCMVSSEGTCAAWFKYRSRAEKGGVRTDGGRRCVRA
jgi:hydrogenase expression/formation protein HypD